MMLFQLEFSNDRITKGNFEAKLVESESAVSVYDWGRSYAGFLGAGWVLSNVALLRPIRVPAGWVQFQPVEWAQSSTLWGLSMGLTPGVLADFDDEMARLIKEETRVTPGGGIRVQP